MIKNVHFITAASFFLCASTQSADWGFETGATIWHTEMTGAINYNNAGRYFNIDIQKDLNMNNGNSSQYYFILYQPIQYLPNLLLATNAIKQRGSGNVKGNEISSSFTNQQVPVNGLLNISHYDITTFWTPINSKPFSLDVGLTYRKFNGQLAFSFSVPDLLNDFKIRTKIENQYLLAYIKSTVYLPMTGLSASILVNFGNNFDSKNSEQAIDADIAIQYRSRIGLGITMGYRYFDVDLESSAEGGTISYKLDTFGPYASISYRY